MVCTLGKIAVVLAPLLAAKAAIAQGGTPVAATGAPAPELTEARPGRWLELSLATGVGTLLGPVGVGAAVLPIPRVALGVGLGWGRYPDFLGIERQMRLVWFVRGYLVDRPRWRLAVGLMTASIDDGLSRAGTTENGQSVTVLRNWRDVRRLDGVLALEVPRGNLAVRFEAGVGRMFGSPDCLAIDPDGRGTSCKGLPEANIPAVHDPEPSRWRSFVGLALAVRPGGTGRATMPGGPPGETWSKHWFDVAATGAVLRGTDLMNDGHYSDYPTFDAGLDVQYLRRVGQRGWRLGLGARWSYGTGESPVGKWEYEHALSLPLLVGWAWQSQATGEQVEIMGGLGPSLLLFSFGSNGHGVMSGTGIAAELGLNYVRPIAPRTAVLVGIGLRAQTVKVNGPADSYYLEHASGFHGEIPLRIGVRVKL